MPLKLPAILSDQMVIQRDQPVKLWGWAEPGERVQVELAGQTAAAKSDENGCWHAILPSLSAGGPHTLTVSTPEERLERRDVLMGDVWVCSGQSNMEFPLVQSNHSSEELAAADYPAIRLFSVARNNALTPETDCIGQWQVCDPNSAASFSAVGYFFGRRLHQTLGVPIGLINTSWGGTTAEAWTSFEALDDEPDFNLLASQAKAGQLPQPLEPHLDPGNEGVKKGWADPSHPVAAWQEMCLPSYWQPRGLVMNGAVWFRKEVTLPADWQGQDLKLDLGVVDDFDVTYFNGEEVGRTGAETPNWWVALRNYSVSEGLVKPGLNVIAVRVFDQWGQGGMVGPESQMKLTRADGIGEGISLAGSWKYQVECELEQRSPSVATVLPTQLYNGMIHPLLPFAIRGAIWYQGESNAGRAYQYRKLFATMIRDWRTRWGQGAFPFLFVQLANFRPRLEQPVESDWAELREAQTMTLSQPNTAMAVAIDIGDAVDIHPRNKQDVGLRLALAAERMVYGLEVVSSGPMYREMQVEQDHIRLRFHHVAEGLVAKDGPLVGFAIAGADRRFVWANAEIDGEDVVVHSPQVKKPVAVRYAWADNPACNLYNSAGLPASPFRTDDWPGITVHAR